METYIAFFDVLGFKEIINNNSLAEVNGLFNNLLRDTQTATSGGQLREEFGALVADLKAQKVNCLHISDSIVFWTNTATEADFKEIVEVCYTLYWRSLFAAFPLRGCLTFGEISFNPQTFTNGGISFFNYSLIGKGLVDSYLKAESIEYAGCVLDKSAIEKLSNDKLITDLIYDEKICYYKVPKKSGHQYEHVFRPIKGTYNDVHFRNKARDIERLFSRASKTNFSTAPENVKAKLNNTIEFIEHFRETDPNSINPNKNK